MERKNLDFEIKDIQEDGSFIAYASTFGNEDFGGDVVMKGAFTKSISEKHIDDILLLAQHDTGEIIGELKSIHEDDKGLLIEGKLFIKDIKRAAETRFLMLKKKLKSLSIGFNIPSGGSFFEDGKRMLKEINLIEISIVTFPMNPEAAILGVKSIKELTPKEIERKLRDVGFSQTEAKALMSEGLKGLKQRDAALDQKKEENKETDVWSEIINQLEK